MALIPTNTVDRLRPHQHGVRNPYGYRQAALGFIEALRIAESTYQLWLCPGCNEINYNDYDPDQDDGSIGYGCSCGWEGSNDDLMLGRK
jgi:hypothetical protein